MTIPNRVKKITVEGNNYDLNYPSTGGLIDIEVLKASLTNDKYESISYSGTNASTFVRYTVDMIASLSVMCPKLKADLKVKTFVELDPLTTKKLLNIYVKEVLPWLNEWEVVLGSDDSETEHTDTAENRE